MKIAMLVLPFTLLLTAAACHTEKPLTNVHPLPYVDAGGPYPQATGDIAPPASPVATPEADLVAACAALDKAHCPEAKPDSANRSCPQHLAVVRSEKTIIPTQCVVDANGDVVKVRACGTKSTLRWRCIVGD